MILAKTIEIYVHNLKEIFVQNLNIIDNKFEVDTIEKRLKSIKFKCNEELFHYLKINYNNSLNKKVLNKLAQFVIIE